MRTELSVHTAGFPTPISPEAGPMPADEGLGIIAMALRTDGSHRYSWTRNKRSPLVRGTRPRTFRRNMISWRRSSAFSASSRLFDLNGEANRVRKKHNRAIIAADVRRFCHQIKRTKFSAH